MISKRGFFSTPNVDESGLRSFGFNERRERKGREELSVYGTIACDINDFNFFKLNVDNGESIFIVYDIYHPKSFLFYFLSTMVSGGWGLFVVISAGTFVVNKFAEGEEVFIAPSNYTGMFVQLLNMLPISMAKGSKG